MSHEVILRGGYVDLRPLVVDDAALTLEWRLGQRAKLLNRSAASVDEQAAWIAARGTNEFNFIIQRKDGRDMGMLALASIDRTHRHGESARFLIGDEAAARGLPASVEAMRLLYDFAFDELDLRRIFGTVVSSNKRMVTWQKFLGMTQEGVMRSHLFIDGKVQDSVLLGMLAEEYRGGVRQKMDALIKLSAAPTN